MSDLPIRDTEGGAGIRIGLTATGLLAIAGLTPLGVREARRRRRLHLVGTGGPEAASAGWEELLAESEDRGLVSPAGETVRAAALRLGREHALDQPGRDGLQALVGAVERSWYSSTPRTSAGDLSDAVDAVRASLARCAPLTPMARLLSRSVLRRRR
ncbi:MAG TPA: DUF4129 domain-containing protein [Pseudonocardiaceae bacterium]